MPRVVVNTRWMTPSGVSIAAAHRAVSRGVYPPGSNPPAAARRRGRQAPRPAASPGPRSTTAAHARSSWSRPWRSPDPSGRGRDARPSRRSAASPNPPACGARDPPARTARPPARDGWRPTCASSTTGRSRDRSGCGRRYRRAHRSGRHGGSTAGAARGPADSGRGIPSSARGRAWSAAPADSSRASCHARRCASAQRSPRPPRYRSRSPGIAGRLCDRCRSRGSAGSNARSAARRDHVRAAPRAC